MLVGRVADVVKQPQQVMVLPVDVSHDLHWRLDLEERRLPRAHHLCLGDDSVDLVEGHVHLRARLFCEQGTARMQHADQHKGTWRWMAI